MGFAKSKTTGTVDTSGVYGPGRQWLGPDKTMKKFDASGHLVSLPSVTVFAASDKLEVSVLLSTCRLVKYLYKRKFFIIIVSVSPYVIYTWALTKIIQ